MLYKNDVDLNIFGKTSTKLQEYQMHAILFSSTNLHRLKRVLYNVLTDNFQMS